MSSDKRGLVEVKGVCDQFLPSARGFVDWVQRNASGASKPTVRELYLLLADLQMAASRLPSDIGEENLSGEDGPTAGRRDAWEMAKRICADLPFNEYSIVLNPVGPDDREAVLKNLDDDVGDIYADLLDGILLYEKGQFGDALWEWQFSYWTHWGSHLVQAQAAVHSYLADGNWSNN
ncbi:MAG: DUF5063 domain-containing protein [Candidatus Aquilonibacter sp.]